jgi:predicted alternative tryptophan synthase beta-subunit
MFFWSKLNKKNHFILVESFALPNITQGAYTYKMAKPVFQLLDIPFLVLVRTPYPRHSPLLVYCNALDQFLTMQCDITQNQVPKIPFS